MKYIYEKESDYSIAFSQESRDYAVSVVRFVSYDEEIFSEEKQTEES